MRPVLLLSVFAAVAICVAISVIAWGTGAAHQVEVSVDYVAAGLGGHFYKNFSGVGKFSRDGYFKVGEWTSLRLTATASRDVNVRLIVEAPDADDQRAAFPGSIVTLEKDRPRRLEVCFKSARANGEIRVRLEDDRGDVLYEDRLLPAAKDAELKPGLPLDVQVRAIAGDYMQIGYGGKPPTSGVLLDDDATSRVVRISSLEELPRDARGLQSLDALIVITGVRATFDAVLPVSPEVSDTLRDWVRGGGHLVISVASQAEAFAASPLAKWVPIPVTGQSPRRQLSGIEIYSQQSAPLSFAGTIDAAKLGPFAGTTLVKELEEPLLVQSPCGFGRVTLIALDVNHSPFSEWPGMSAVWRKLLADDRGDGSRKTASGGQLSHLGMSDLATQLHAAQEEFPAVERLSNWSVMGLLLLYVAVIGPLDYFLTHRWLRRPEWTWVTFPAWICLAGAAAAWGAGRLNGNELRANQLDLVDIDAESGLVRGRTWLTVYSPETRRYAVDVAPMSQQGWSGYVEQQRIAWNAVPENTVGGLYRTGGAARGGRSYSLADDATSLANVPVQKWSTQEVVAEWEASGANVVTSTLESGGPGRLVGSVAHKLPVPLEECLLAYGGRMYTPGTNRDKLGTLTPHQEWEPSGSGQQRELRGFLTGTTAVRIEKSKKRIDSEIRFQTQPYNPLNHDLGDLVRMISFHETAGGSGYTGLENLALRELELTRLAATGRAVLIGRVNLPASGIAIDGKPHEPDSRAAFVRIVLPVKQPSSPDANFVPNPVIR